MALKFRQKYGQGVRVAYWRDMVRPRILRTPPIDGLADDRCEIHAMTSGVDWLNLIWALKSFYAVSQRRYKLCIHEDGSVEDGAIDRLKTHFPCARVIRRADADRRLAAKLAGYPRCAEFRRTNLLSPKVFDPAEYLEAGRMLLLDSDVLFFRAPDVLLHRIDDPQYQANSFNPDCASGYTISPSDALSFLGLELAARVNSGLGLVHPQSMRLDWIEEFLGAPGLVAGHFWRIEQTLFALASSRYGVELLPDDYAVHLGKGIGPGPCRHYVGAVRHLMYSEGMRRLVREGFLQ